ncbi:Protein phosphatase 2C [Cynara cardunculus var. scolymus]|uniref:protein-serine/threonine phosphatase n=1 Tax=Cynara cardunculus var. scolymus TaxID=59895 RepID=A0A103YBA0_CYNCS|nr:Protein phosphatase 2C [Cynara cardunculus var. scolymus]
MAYGVPAINDTTSNISESDSDDIFEITEDEFNNRNLVIGSPVPAAGEIEKDPIYIDDDLGIYEELDDLVQVESDDDHQICIGRNNQKISWGFCVDQGMRKYMEDRIVTFPSFMSLRCDSFGGCTAPHCRFASEVTPIHYFAVFDGHGGSQVSDHCADSLHEEVKKAWESEDCTNEWNKRWQSALSRAYDSADKACEEETGVGSTALVVLVSACQIVAANCGDSRAILCRGSQIIPLSEDHRPDREDEEQRIAKSGGRVLADLWGVLRVDGVLAMSRAIGDKSLKPSVSSVPELTFTTRSEEDECIIIASDGLWDVVSTECVGNLACELLQHERQSAHFGESPTQYVAECLFKEACSRSSSDNFSVIVVDLKPARRN